MVIPLDNHLHSTSEELELFQLTIGAKTIRWTFNSNSITWLTKVYPPIAGGSSGFGAQSSGGVLRPSVSIQDINNLLSIDSISNAFRTPSLFEGKQLIRRRVKTAYLDDSPTADPFRAENPEFYTIQQFEPSRWPTVNIRLSTPLDVEDLKHPRRIMPANSCVSEYRGDFCGYTGPPVATIEDVPTTIAANDECSLTRKGCRLRFPTPQALRISSFPGAKFG